MPTDGVTQPGVGCLSLGTIELDRARRWIYHKGSMPGNNDKEPTEPAGSSDGDKSTARQWFGRAKGLVDSHNYDYAIECYVNGLERWPEAVDEGHKPLFATAMFRAAAGGKKPGTMDSFKYPMTGKDARKAMLNAEYLMAKDPKNPIYLEGVFKNAVRAGIYEAAMWVGPIFQDACQAEKKPSAQRFRLLVDLYVEMGEKLAAADKVNMAIEALDRAVKAMARLRQIDTKNLHLMREATEIATKLTILKGKYQTAESFVDSVRDADVQRDLRDSERLVQADDRLDDLVAKARAELASNPEVPAKVMRLVDLLCKREEDAAENEAIETLLVAYRKTDNYPFKMRADDIRMRQFRRKANLILKKGDKEAAKRQYREQLKFELGVFRERVEQYPTDLRIRFEYGRRLFKAHDYDQAIPVFQEARADPKSRAQCSFYIGRCFFERGYHDQAIAVLSEAIGAQEIEGDAVSRDLHYWLARSYEAAGQKDEALKVYGKLLTWDYNYRDVRDRMDNLKGKG
jgi:tetratricopeptide (TPR) repeat protein